MRKQPSSVNKIHGVYLQLLQLHLADELRVSFAREIGIWQKKASCKCGRIVG